MFVSSHVFSVFFLFFFFSSRRRHTRWNCDWSSDVCSSDLPYHLSRRSRWRRKSRGARDAVHGFWHGGAGAWNQCAAVGNGRVDLLRPRLGGDRKSTRLNSSHSSISYAVFCLKKKKTEPRGL